MDFATGLWTLGGVALGGIIAAITQAVTIRATQRGERDARLWSKQAELYLAVIEAVHAYGYNWGEMLWCDKKANAIAAHLDALIRFEPQLRAFGSSEAGEAYRKYLLAASGVARGVANIHHWIEVSREPDSAWIELPEADHDAIWDTVSAQDEALRVGAALIQAMRADLGGNHPRRTSRGLASISRRLSDSRERHNFARARRRVARHPRPRPEVTTPFVTIADGAASQEVPPQLDE